MNLLILIWREFSVRVSRSALTIAGVALAFTAGLSLHSIVRGFERQARIKYEARNAGILVSGTTHFMPVWIDEEIGARLASMDGVEAVAAGLWELQETDASRVVGFLGWTPESFLWEHLQMMEGRLPRPDEEAVVLGEIAARILNKRPGDTVEFHTGDLERVGLRVTGIFRSAALSENALALLGLPVLQRLKGAQGKANYFNLRLAPGMDAEGRELLRQRIREAFPGLRVVLAGSHEGRNPALRLAAGFSLACGLLALAVSATGISSFMLMNVSERSQELACLRALGWRTGRVVMLVLGHAALISSAGAILGAGLSALLVMSLRIFPMTAGRIDADLAGPLVPVALAIAPLLGMMAAAYPAAVAVSRPPSHVLRQIASA